VWNDQVQQLREQARLLPDEPGVYRFRDARGKALYLGRATSLRRRVASYLSDSHPEPMRPWLVRMTAQIERIEACVCRSVHEASWLERSLHRRSLPRWNRATGGQEKPLLLRLDPHPAHPGLTVQHPPVVADGCEWFGPYLGGTALRCAVRGLLRVRPLDYAGHGLGGSARSMAASRGVGPTDHPWLTAEVRRVLRREAASISSVCDDLASRRGFAVADLQFERAGEISDEINAIQWLGSTQRVARLAAEGSVTEPSPPTSATGWAAGVAVRLDFHTDSWLQVADRWTITRREEPVAQCHDPVLAALVRVNAKLAARLAAGGQVCTRERHIAPPR
jgi:excinuclease ABC subunit C